MEIATGSLVGAFNDQDDAELVDDEVDPLERGTESLFNDPELGRRSLNTVLKDSTKPSSSGLDE